MSERGLPGPRVKRAGGSAPWWITRTSTAVLLLLHAISAFGSSGPTVLLFGANLEEIRGLAVDSALWRGWRLISLAPDSAAFEQTLEEAPDDATHPARVIRVLARFQDESGGVRVQLGAEEIEAPGTSEERSTDVTGRYGLNLTNALNSLRARWDNWHPALTPWTRPGPQANTPGTQADPSDLNRGLQGGLLHPGPRPHGAIDPSQGDHEPFGHDGAPTEAEPLGTAARLGTWAYYAEIYAQDRGCSVADSGARLEFAGAEWERHRIPCRDGSWLRVYCRFGVCTAASP